MKYKHIEAAREVRMWLGQIIIPTAVIVSCIPSARHAIDDKIEAFRKKRQAKKRES